MGTEDQVNNNHINGWSILFSFVKAVRRTCVRLVGSDSETPNVKNLFLCSGKEDTWLKKLSESRLGTTWCNYYGMAFLAKITTPKIQLSFLSLYAQITPPRKEKKPVKQWLHVGFHHKHQFKCLGTSPYYSLFPFSSYIYIYIF